MKKDDLAKNGLQWQRLLSEFNKSLSLITDIYHLNSNVKAKIKELTGVGEVYVFIYKEELNEFVNLDKTGEDTSAKFFSFRTSDKLIFWMDVNRTNLLCQEESDIYNFLSQREQDFIRENGIIYIYPLIAMNRVKGLVMLNNKVKEEKISGPEMEVLRVFLDQAAFAFENALMYKQQKDRTRKMYRADRLATLGELAAGAAHEIRNPLTSIRSSIQYLHKKMSNEEDCELMNDIIDEVDRINEIITGMLSFSKNENPEREQVNLKNTLEQIFNLATNAARKKAIKLTLNYETSNEMIYADQGQLKQVLLNILMNAIQFIDHDHGKVIISVNNTGDHNGKYEENIKGENYIIRIKDNGKGIEPAKLEKIFDPFYTTRSEGTGLGLSISYGIVHKHNGEIEIESIPEKETTVTIKLPVNQ